MNGNLLKVFTTLTILLFSVNSWSQDEDLGETSSSSGSSGFEFSAGIEIPTQIGIRGKYNIDRNWFISAGLGYSASFLVQIGTGLATNLGTFTEDATMMDDALANAIYLDLRGGYNFRGTRFFVEGGFSTMFGGGQETTLEKIDDVTQEGPYTTTSSTINVQSAVQSLVLNGGYVFKMGRKWRLTTTAGIVKPLANTTTLDFSQFYINEDFVESDLQDGMNQAYGSLFFITAAAWFTYLF